MNEGLDTIKILNLRVTFKNAPIQALEKFTFKNLEDAYRGFLEIPGVKECVLMQTCNRVEIFLAHSNVIIGKIVETWATITGVQDSFLKYVELSEDKNAVRHLMSLTSGLESLVVGEDQILGQVRRAFEYARVQKYVGFDLSLIFDRAIKIGTRIRNQSGLNKGSLSVGSVAVNLAEDYFDDLTRKNVLLIGTGEGASLIAKSLNKRHLNFMVASRTYDRARCFSESVGGKPIEFESALSSFSNVDLVFVSTTAPYFLLTYDRVQIGMTGRKHGLMIFDLSNPRTVEDKVASISGVKLVNMDQIAEMVDRNMRNRQFGIRCAESMLEEEILFVDHLFRKKRAEPFVVSIFKSVEEVRERELSKAAKMMSIRPGTKEFRVLEQLSFAIVEGILSTPMNNFRKEIGSYEKNQEILNIISRIFDYDKK
jgi:glutamyl-tRNA reductase